MEKEILVREACPTSTREWIKKGALIVDVREKAEVEKLAFDVPEILNIPLSEFEEKYAQVPRDRNVIIVCKDGTKSLRAAAFLMNHGYTTVAKMKHGLVKWVHKGFPVKGAPSTIEEANSCCSGSGCC